MKQIIQNDRVYILAEIAQSYEGNVETLIDISKGACGAGADGIMFQVVLADELAVKNYTHYRLFQSLEMPDETWARVIKTIHADGKMAVGEVFGKKSAELMVKNGIDALKIHASDLSNLPLLDSVGEMGKAILLSIGGAYHEEIEQAIAVLTNSGTNKEIILMHGYQACPTAIDETHLGKMRYIEQKYDLPIGYSDHVAGCIDNDHTKMNENSYYMPLVALGAGAKLIEKHIIIDRSKAWEDYESAISVDEFGRFVQLIRTYEKCMGKKDLLLNTSENNYRKAAKKHIVAAEKILKGNVITEAMITYKRIENKDNGICNLHDVIGKTVKTDLNIDDPVTDSLLI